MSDCRRLLRDHALGERLLKGKAEAVRVWEVVSAHQARSRLDIEVERGLTPLMGRERELAQLTACFDMARAGRGQVVFIVGEPGIGKSRLLHEYRRRVRDAGWFEGRCLSFGQSMVFHPLVDLLRRAFDIDEADGEETIIAKVEEPLFRYVLGVNAGDPSLTTMDPQERRAEVFQALRRFFLRAAERAPLVIVFEDLHWIDGATEEWLSV